MNYAQGKPSEATNDGDFARALLTLLGPAYQGQDGTNNAADFLAFGGQLSDVRAILQDVVSEMFVHTAYDLLTELEVNYGLPVRADLPQATRQQRLLAKVRATRAGTPSSILVAVRTIDPAATLAENALGTNVVHELDNPTTRRRGAVRGVYQFGVLVSATTYATPASLATVRAVVDQMKPAHASYDVGVNGVFRCDDANSLTDRDLLGS